MKANFNLGLPFLLVILLMEIKDGYETCYDYKENVHKL